jgi:hypothetical protein
MPPFLISTLPTVCSPAVPRWPTLGGGVTRPREPDRGARGAPDRATAWHRRAVSLERRATPPAASGPAVECEKRTTCLALFFTSIVTARRCEPVGSCPRQGWGGA